MATLSVSYENRDRLASEFNNFFKDNCEKPSFHYKSIIIKGSNDKNSLAGLFLLLDHNRVLYSKLPDTIMDFAKKGGKVVALENSVTMFSKEKSTSLFKSVETKAAEDKAEAKKTRSDDPGLLRKFEDRNRYSLSERSASSIYPVRTDTTNPYAFGLKNMWFILKRTKPLPFLESGSNICYIVDKEPIAGFPGYKFKQQVKNTLIMGSERKGSGELVYITDDPYFRAFWKSGRILLGNIILR